MKKVYKILDNQLELFTDKYTATGGQIYYDVVKSYRNVKKVFKLLSHHKRDGIYFDLLEAKYFLMGQVTLLEIEKKDTTEINYLYNILKGVK